jgi:hypothetical protein
MSMFSILVILLDFNISSFREYFDNPFICGLTCFYFCIMLNYFYVFLILFVQFSMFIQGGLVQKII